MSKEPIKKVRWPRLVGDHPTIEITSTGASNGQWLVEGFVEVAFSSNGGSYYNNTQGALSVKMPFSQAESQDAAIDQASESLRAFANDLLRIADALQEKGQSNLS